MPAHFNIAHLQLSSSTHKALICGIGKGNIQDMNQYLVPDPHLSNRKKNSKNVQSLHTNHLNPLLSLPLESFATSLTQIFLAAFLR